MHRRTNLFDQLCNRETHSPRPNTQVLLAREVYVNLYPNHTFYDVQVPNGATIRKFSPNGELLVCISKNQHAVVVYQFKTPTMSKPVSLGSDGAPRARTGGFEEFFTLKYERLLTQGDELLCRDFCLFTEDARFMILASATLSTGTLAEARVNPSSLQSIPNLEDVRFILVDTQSGDLCDTRAFKNDCIFLANHAGVHFHKNMLAILSVQHQSIHILQIKDTGTFVDLRHIGPHCYEDDELRLADFHRRAELAMSQATSEAVVPNTHLPQSPRTDPSRPATPMHTPPVVSDPNPFLTGLNSPLLPPGGASMPHMLTSPPLPLPGISLRASRRPLSARSLSNESTFNQPPTTAVPNALVIPPPMPVRHSSTQDLDLLAQSAVPTITPPISHGPPSVSSQSGRPITNGFVSSSSSSSSPDPTAAAAATTLVTAARPTLLARRMRRSSISTEFTTSPDQSPQAEPASSRPVRPPPPTLTTLTSVASQHSRIAIDPQTRSPSVSAAIAARSMVHTPPILSAQPPSQRPRLIHRIGQPSSPARHFTLFEPDHSPSPPPVVELRPLQRIQPDTTTSSQPNDAMEVDAGSSSSERAESDASLHSFPSVTSNGLSHLVARPLTPQPATQLAPTPRGTSLASAGPRPIGGQLFPQQLQPRPSSQQPTQPPPQRHQHHHHHHTPTAQQPNQGRTTRHQNVNALPEVGENTTRDQIAPLSPLQTTTNMIGVTTTAAAAAAAAAAATRPPELPYSGMKQRLLSFLYRAALRDSNPVAALRHFYVHFAHLELLIMTKLQFLNSSHLLIKLNLVDAVISRNSDFSTQIAFFMVYNINTTEVIAVFENSSEEFLDFYEQYCDFLRMGSSMGLSHRFVTTCSNNVHVREHMRSQNYSSKQPLMGGRSLATRRVLSALPFAPQSFFDSPYLDKSLFSYDDKFISASHRPKPYADFPIKFYSRRTGAVKFKINTSLLVRTTAKTKRCVTYVFHPYLPFIISVQQTLHAPTVVNFHVRL